MKRRILSIISVVFFAAFVSAVNTPKVIANTDNTKSLSEKETKKKVSNYNHEAKILLYEGRTGDKSKYKEAIKKCEKAIKLDPDYADSYLLLGEIYSSMGQYDKADSTFDKAAALESDFTEVINKATETIALLAKGELSPNIPKINLSTAAAAYFSTFAKEWSWQKEVERAKKENANLRKMSPNERKEYEEKMKKISSESISHMKKEDRIEKESQLLNKGITFIDKGKYNKAIEKFKEIIKSNPNNASAYYWLGIAYSEKEDYNKMEDYSKANEVWGKAISIDPKLNSNVSNMKKINQEHQSMTPEEKRAYQKRIKAYRAEMALPAEERKRLKEERKKLENEEEAEWDCLAGRRDLVEAWLHKNNKKYEEAIINFKKALELKPDYEDAIIGIGDAYYLQKLYNQAIEEYKKVIAKKPKSIKAHLGLKRCYMTLKKYDEAKKECNIILKLDPNNTEAKECLKNLQPNKSQYK